MKGASADGPLPAPRHDASVIGTVGKPRVLIAGVGVAAVEAALALHAFAPNLVDTCLLAPSPRVELPPLAVLRPFRDVGLHLPLSALTARTGARIARGAVAHVDPERHVVATGDGRMMRYDVLVVAVGARREPQLGNGVVTFAGAGDAPAVRELLERVVKGARRGVTTRLAFVVPEGPGWPLPAYELALLTAHHLRRGAVTHGATIDLVTPEPAPLALFGPATSAAVAGDLAAAGVAFHPSASVQSWSAGRLWLVPGASLAADRVVSLPRLRGPAIPGLPADGLGFVPADEWGRVGGLGDVFVVGDAGPFPIKQGGVACAQADAVASVIARDAGADVDLIPFDPALSALLLEGSQERWMRSGLSWTYELERVVGKVAGRFLSPFLGEVLPGPSLPGARIRR
jgi:sulfide:quinone oxidoreductase